MAMEIDPNDPIAIVAELTRQREHAGQQLALVNQENQQLRTLLQNQAQQQQQLEAQIQGAVAARQDIMVLAGKVANRQPTYSHDGTQSWTVFMSERTDWARLYNIERGNVGDEWHKNALIASLKGTAREMITGQEEHLRQLNWDDFIRQLESTFQPAGESKLMKDEFKQRKQAAQEDIVRYLSTKEALFRRAFVYDAANLQVLFDHTVRGIYNRSVKEKMLLKMHDLDNPITTFAQLRQYATTYVACERSLLKQGLGQSTSMDGLGATGTIRSDSLFNTGEEPMDIGNLNAMGGGGDRKCFNCDRPGHLARECKLPRRQGGAGRGNGGASGRGNGQGRPPAAGRGNNRTTNEECRRCGRKGHFKRDCFSRKDTKGNILPANTGKPKPQVRSMLEEGDGITEDSD